MRKLIGIILLPIYLVTILVTMIFCLLVIITNLEKTFLGRVVEKLRLFSENFYYKFYGAIDERDN